LSIYFNSAGRAKVEQAVALGQRETIKECGRMREQARVMRQHG